MVVSEVSLTRKEGSAYLSGRTSRSIVPNILIVHKPNNFKNHINILLASLAVAEVLELGTRVKN